MAEERFVRFLLTGTVGDVAVGSSEAAVRERLGAPPETTRLRRGVTLWAYGGRVLQVTLQRDRVVLIGIYLRYASANTADLLAGGVPLSPKTDRAMLRGKLDAWHIPYRESREWPEAYDVGDARVIAAFGEDGLLESFQVAIRK